MPTISWDTVVTAAATAVFVTLAVEYFAKPRLEARKERILDALRARRELLTLITRLSISARMYAARLPDSAARDLQRVWDAERNRQYQLMHEQALQLSDNVARFANSYPRQLDDVLMGYAFAVHGIVLSMRPRHQKAELIADLAIPIATAIEVPRPWPWRLWRMARAQIEVRRKLAEIGAVADSANP